jgi:hypothetical protein
MSAEWLVGAAFIILGIAYFVIREFVTRMEDE